MNRIYLSPPDMGGEELELVKEAFASNWIAPLGPHVTAFEQEVCARVGVGHGCATSSGTAALHLALRLCGVERGDTVWCSSFTFAATANAVTYLGAEPVFIDSETTSWNMDPDLLAEALEDANRTNRLPKAVVPVDLYGQCADYDAIVAACRRYDIPVVEDAAEALGATYRGRQAGSLGDMAVLSFNGNKIITTSGGGMLLSDNADHVRRALFLATQARDDAPWYQHSTIGYNYRLSNVLAAIGRGQLRTLDDKIAKRRRNFAYYERHLGDVPGVTMMPLAPWGTPNYWLTCILIDAEVTGADTHRVRAHLERCDIEARPLWKPMHLQPVFRECRAVGGAVCAGLFRDGLCLPSGSAMTESDLDRVVTAVQEVVAP